MPSLYLRFKFWLLWKLGMVNVARELFLSDILDTYFLGGLSIDDNDEGRLFWKGKFDPIGRWLYLGRKMRKETPDIKFSTYSVLKPQVFKALPPYIQALEKPHPIFLDRTFLLDCQLLHDSDWLWNEDGPSNLGIARADKLREDYDLVFHRETSI
jgi:hypothetical protein